MVFFSFGLLYQIAKLRSIKKKIRLVSLIHHIALSILLGIGIPYFKLMLGLRLSISSPYYLEGFGTHKDAHIFILGTYEHVGAH